MLITPQYVISGFNKTDYDTYLTQNHMLHLFKLRDTQSSTVTITEDSIDCNQALLKLPRGWQIVYVRVTYKN